MDDALKNLRLVIVQGQDYDYVSDPWLLAIPPSWGLEEMRERFLVEEVGCPPGVIDGNRCGDYTRAHGQQSLDRLFVLWLIAQGAREITTEFFLGPGY